MSKKIFLAVWALGLALANVLLFTLSQSMTSATWITLAFVWLAFLSTLVFQFLTATKSKTPDDAFLHIPALAVSIVYAQKEYFQIKATTHVKTEVFNLSFPVVYLIRLENGYLFYFQFLGADSGPYFEDFISLINSVQYPHVDHTSADSILSPAAQMAPGVPSAIIVAGVITIVLGVLFFIWVFRHKPSGGATAEQSVSISPGSASAGPAEDLPMAQQIDARETPGDPEPGPGQAESIAVLVCSCCGAELPLDSMFCHKCGTKVEKAGDEQD